MTCFNLFANPFQLFSHNLKSYLNIFIEGYDVAHLNCCLNLEQFGSCVPTSAFAVIVCLLTS